MNWKTETRKVADLKGWDINPRKIEDEDFDELVSSLDELGNFEPLVINTDGTVIAGNQRLKASVELGLDEVEVSVPDRKLTQKEIKKIGVLSNRHAGEWDMDLLADEFADMVEELGLEDIMPFTDEGLDTEFSLKDGDKEPFRQMTFTFADEQANIIEEAIKEVRKVENYELIDKFGNENGNGNALYTIIHLWQEQRRLK